MGAQAIDYYEFLQISPHADADTIHRVYRFLAARLHPDNHATGHVDNFRLLKAAYDVLSDPRRRAEYDATRIDSSSQPLSTTIDFMDSLEGELNRRMAVLAVLYYRRRTSPNFPEVALGEIEERMGFPARLPGLHALVSTEEGVYLEGRQCTIHSDRRWRGFCGEGAQQTSDPAQAADQRFRIVGRRSGTKPTKRGDCFLAESLGACAWSRPFPPANRASILRPWNLRKIGGRAGQTAALVRPIFAPRKWKDASTRGTGDRQRRHGESHKSRYSRAAMPNAFILR